MLSGSLHSPSPRARSDVAANVRRLRKAMGLSQEKLGERVDLHRTYISRLERRKANISLDNLERVAWVLGAETAELLQPAPPGTDETPG